MVHAHGTPTQIHGQVREITALILGKLEAELRDAEGLTRNFDDWRRDLLDLVGIHEEAEPEERKEDKEEGCHRREGTLD